MPYIKPKEVPFIAVTRLLKGYDASAVTIARKTGWSYCKAADRMERPERLTLGEITELARKFHIPKEEMMEAIGRWA